MSVFVVVTTVGTEEQANLIGEELVRRRHAACVNIIPIQRSVYRWQGKLCRDSEYLLVIKTLPEEYELVEKAIHQLHQYELPEILAFSAERSETRFSQWIADCIDKGAGDDDDDAGEESDEDGEGGVAVYLPERE